MCTQFGLGHIFNAHPSSQYINTLNPNQILWEGVSASHFTLVQQTRLFLDTADSKLVDLHVYCSKESFYNGMYVM
jgi:hypothetical protein